MVDYSNWKKIELSSDEDDVHPFIETSTLFRMKHEARLKKMEERKKEEFAYECRKAILSKRIEEVHTALQKYRDENEDVRVLQNQLQELETEREELAQKENKLKKGVPWYIDTICQPSFSKTSISSSLLENAEKPEDYSTFFEKNEVRLKQFASLKTFDNIKKFLIVHQNLIQRSTLYFLVSYGIELYLKEKTDKLNLVCRQIVLLLHVLELFKKYQQHSKELLISFFTRVNSSGKCFKEEFKKECEKVQNLIQKLVLNKVFESEENETTGENQSASLDECDPVNVFNSLPEDMQEAFILQDKNTLAKALSKMPAQKAKCCMQRCIQAGLWIPDEHEN